MFANLLIIANAGTYSQLKADLRYSSYRAKSRRDVFSMKLWESILALFISLTFLTNTSILAGSSFRGILHAKLLVVSYTKVKSFLPYSINYYQPIG